MELRLFRHATMLLTLGGIKILVDPILSPAGTMAPIDNSANPRPNPLVEMVGDEKDLLAADALLLTHTHRDHFDAVAAARLTRTMPVYCQPEDKNKLIELGFVQVTAVQDTANIGKIGVSRTGGQHGTGEIGRQMAPVSGYVLRAPGEPVVYLAGDTVWCPEVETALAGHQPEVIILYAGAAQFLVGDPITMSGEDVAKVCEKAPQARIVAVHMETFNHCFLTRPKLQAFLAERGLDRRVAIPADGESLSF